MLVWLRRVRAVSGLTWSSLSAGGVSAGEGVRVLAGLNYFNYVF